MLLMAPSSRMFCSLSWRRTRQADSEPTRPTPNSAPSDGGERDRQRGQRHRKGVDALHEGKRQSEAEHAGEDDHPPVAVSARKLERSKHGSVSGLHWAPAQPFAIYFHNLE